MPNIRQILALKENYDSLKRSDNRLKDFLNKGLLDNVAIEKAFSFDVRNKLNEHFDLAQRMPSLVEYFESKPEEEIVLLFIDIANFSIITEKKDNEFITNYLDSFYRRTIPIIYEFGGQVEKLMGDGIVCVFGKPFIDVEWPDEFNRAELCAQKIINRFYNTDKEVKIALHSGFITYYKTPGTNYEEYTMIGRPITELFRLESVSRKNAINFYTGGIYYSMNPTTHLSLSQLKSEEIILRNFDTSLPGVKFSNVSYIKFR
ncbi:MAG: adenylate/guanylate cyclase domain-containing protein [Bacteroidales bacterium]|jgi:class 3 adenylate cyclase|nr:adenylate/guanylate cyclase domain-containing protein [Bacteroidales bacterium]